MNSTRLKSESESTVIVAMRGNSRREKSRSPDLGMRRPDEDQQRCDPRCNRAAKQHFEVTRVEMI